MNIPPEKDYGLNLSLYSNDEVQLLAERKKLLIAATVFLALGALTITLYIGILLIIISLFLFNGASTRKKVIAQSRFEKTRRAEQTKKIEEADEVSVQPNVTVKQDSTRSLSKMPVIDFSRLNKNTPYSKIFPLIVIDVETTGLHRRNDKIVEVSAIKYTSSFTPSERFSTLINPLKPIPAETSEINHITDDMVKDSPTFSQIRQQLQSFVEGCNIAGYFLRFDLEFLFHQGLDLSEDVRYYDICELAKSRIPSSRIKNYKLKTVCDYYNIPIFDAHRSLSDAFAASEVFQRVYLNK
ncbi:MAG: 3'-5' exonuclease [Oscillospiraceae bacterium]|nr:3'-5' exonuclease [Oscillospiraceae bacterium]